MVGLNLMKAVDHEPEAYFSLGEEGVGCFVSERGAQETGSIMRELLKIS